MNSYLVRKTQLDGTIIEYEVYGIEDARTAATVVFEDLESTAVHMRDRFDSTTGVETPFNPDDYAEVVNIVAHQVSSLPVRKPVSAELRNEFDLAGLAAAQLYAERTGGSKEPGPAVENFMRGLVDLSFEIGGVDISETMSELGRDRGDNAEDDSPRLLVPLLKSLSVELGGDTAAAREALDLYVRESGVEGAEDPAVAFYHAIYSSIEVAERHGVDFTHMMALVLENESEPAASPVIG